MKGFVMRVIACAMMASLVFAAGCGGPKPYFPDEVADLPDTDIGILHLRIEQAPCALQSLSGWSAKIQSIDGVGVLRLGGHYGNPLRILPGRHEFVISWSGRVHVMSGFPPSGFSRFIYGYNTLHLDIEPGRRYAFTIAERLEESLEHVNCFKGEHVRISSTPSSSGRKVVEVNMYTQDWNENEARWQYRHRDSGVASEE